MGAFACCCYYKHKILLYQNWKRILIFATISPNSKNSTMSISQFTVVTYSFNKQLSHNSHLLYNGVYRKGEYCAQQKRFQIANTTYTMANGISKVFIKSVDFYTSSSCCSKFKKHNAGI